MLRFTAVWSFLQNMSQLGDSPLSSLRNVCVLSCQEWCHNYKRELGYQQTHKTSKDRVHIIDLFQLIPFFSFWQERHRQEQQINNIFKEKFKQIIECTHHHHQIFSDITAKIFNSSYQSSHYDIHVWNFSCGHSVWKGSRNIAISSESIKTLDIISDKFFHSCNIFNTVNWYF